MNWFIVVPTVAAKFLLPVALIWFPFAAGWANFVLDSVDGDILVPAGYGDNPVAEDNSLYQTTDKVADFVTYIFMVVAAWKWPVRRWIIGLFAFRAVGQVLYFMTRNELVFVYLPNFLEPLFLVCATILRFNSTDPWGHLIRHKWIYGGFVFLYKMQDEIFTHLLNIDRTDALRRLFGGG
jgi:hypothetical protein